MITDIFSRFIQKRLGWSQEVPRLFITFFAIAVPTMISTAQPVVAEDFDINSPYECYNCHLLVTPPEERTPVLYDTDVIDPHHSPYAADYDPSVPDDWRHAYNVYFPDAPTSCGFCHSNTYENQGGGIRQGVACGECHLYGACPSTIWQIGLPQNDPPVLDPIGDQMGYEGVLLTFTVTATDPNSGDTLTFSASNLPPGASFDPTTGRFLLGSSLLFVRRVRGC